MAKLRRSTRAPALIAAVVVALLLTMAGSGLAAPGDTALVSVASSGEQGNLDSYQPSISTDGRYVAFASVSDNLVEGDTNGVIDIFVRDHQAGTTERVSVDNQGNQQNDQQQRDGETFCGLDMSADGRYVAFSSAADNLVANDTNAACDVFVRDLQAGTTELVSIHDSGEQANGDSWYPSISADGRYVSFHHGPDDLVGNDTNERYDVYVRDLQAGTTERVSIDSSGNPINGSSWNASISADGRYVAFLSDGINLVPDDNNDPSSHDVLVRDLQAGTTEKVSVTSSGQQASAPSGDYPSISADGRYVVFNYQADDLVPEDTNGDTDVFVRDLQAGTTELVSVSSSGEQGRWMSNYASISADGRYVAFQSLADNLVANDTNSWDVFVRDLQKATTELISVASSGEQANSDTFGIPSISDDGRYVAFDSNADNLVANDTNGSGDGYRQDGSDVFLHERQAQDGTPPDTTTPPDATTPPDTTTPLDTTPPTADIVTPADGAVYVRNQGVGADYSCEDEAGGSGLKSCEGTVAKGQPIDTGSLGPKTFTVRATDNAGNVSYVTSTYTVAECHITGTPGDDVLEGSASSDRICGLGGNDTLEGLGGNDELVGGAGDDTLEGGPGTDTADFTASALGVTASLVTNQATGDGFDIMTSIENLIGSPHDDTLIGSGSRNYLFGRSGVDQLFGLEGHDRLAGGSQDDALRGGTGDDRIVANAGSDDLFGEEGSDLLNSKDSVEVNDALDGGTGTDACSTDAIEESIASCEQQRD
jgi:Ca2+-binding RTX toxin-like protein